MAKAGTEHYKANWTLLQRLLWLPLFKEWYEDKYRFMVYLSYIHAVFALLTIIIFLADELSLINVILWHYVFVGYIFYNT